MMKQMRLCEQRFTMTVLILTLLLISASRCHEQVLTPARRNQDHHNKANIAKHRDAEHRGHAFYDLSSNPSVSSSKFASTSSSSSFYSDGIASTSHSSDASSAITSEKKSAKKLYRDCTPCIFDMLKRHSNIGIKWICGVYQRSRRSFKSECMMRYRNCQDGTMFVKMADHRCQRNPYHGHSWFYIYKV